MESQIRENLTLRSQQSQQFRMNRMSYSGPLSLRENNQSFVETLTSEQLNQIVLFNQLKKLQRQNYVNQITIVRLNQKCQNLQAIVRSLQDKNRMKFKENFVDDYELQLLLSRKLDKSSVSVETFIETFNPQEYKKFIKINRNQQSQNSIITDVQQKVTDKNCSDDPPFAFYDNNQQQSQQLQKQQPIQQTKQQSYIFRQKSHKQKRKFNLKQFKEKTSTKYNFSRS